VIAALFTSGCVALACGLPSAEEFSSGSPPAPDAGRDTSVADVLVPADTSSPDQFVPVDAGVDADADAAVDADADAGPGDGLPPHGPNLLFNGGFEIACTNWLTYNTSASSVPIARTGASGCRVCAEAPDNPQFSAEATVPVKPNERYFGEVWLHASPTDDASAGATIGAALLYGSTENSSYVAGVARTDDWTRVGVFYTTTKTENSVKLLITVPPGTCIILDDAAVYKLD